MRLFQNKQRHSSSNPALPRVEAKSWDIMQYAQHIVQKKHDGQIRCAVFFRGSLKLERLKQAVRYSLEVIPELGGRYIPDDKFPFWQIRHADMDELFGTVTTNCTDDEIVAFLPGRADPFRGPQIRFKLVCGQARDTLCIVANRMILDEAGLKEYLYLLSRIYSGLHSPNFQLPQPEKQQMQRVLRVMPPITRLKAQYRQQPPLEIPRIKQTFPFSGKEDVPFIVTHTLPVSRYQAVARYAVHRHMQVEEVLLTAYVRAVFAMLRDKPQDPFPIIVQTDLRRFLPWGLDHTAHGLSLPILFVSPAKLPRTFHETLTLIHARLLQLHKVAAVVENAKSLGCYPFSAKQMQEHMLLPELPYYSFNHIGKIDAARLEFGQVDINDAYITGPIYKQPNVCLCSTVYEDSMTFSCNLNGTRDDWATCKYFLALLVRELPADT